MSMAQGNVGNYVYILKILSSNFVLVIKFVSGFLSTWRIFNFFVYFRLRQRK